MSDLQCPARIVLARRTTDAAVLDEVLRHERVAQVIASATAVDLEAVADLHRGETVLVVAEAGPHVDRGRDPLVLEIDADGMREISSSPNA